MKPAVYQAESSIGFCHISFYLPIVLGKWRLKWHAPHHFGVCTQTLGHLVTHLSVPLESQAQLQVPPCMDLSHRALVSDGNHRSACFVVFAAVVVVVTDHCYNYLASDHSNAADLEYTFLLHYSFYPLKGITVKVLRGVAFVSVEWFLICSFSSHLSAQNQHEPHSALVYLSPCYLSEMLSWFFLA